MPIYEPHLYLTFGGFLGTTKSNPGEIWQCGLRVAANRAAEWAWDPNTPHQADQGILATSAAPLIQNWVVNGIGDLSNAAKLTWVKCASIGVDGKYTQVDPDLVEFSPVAAPLGGGVQHPYQVSRVLSMGSTVNRGRATRGRIYSPSPRAEVDVNNLVSSGNAVSNFKDLIDGLNNITLADVAGVQHYARVGLFSGVDGTSRMVTRVASDTKLDIQRRRADQIETDLSWTPVTT